VWLLVLAGTSCGVAAQSIFTCVDAKGRRLTSDRPIAECNDREQRELTPNGTVRRTLKPVPTADERARQEALDKASEEERAQIAEERRRDKALLVRYPNRAAHDKERADALLQVDEVTKAAQKRVTDLQEQRKGMEAEMEFYRKDPSKAPAALKRQLDENTNSTAAQRRFIAAQEEEKRRVNVRFDEEVVKLRPLWAGQPLASSGAAASAASASSAAADASGKRPAP
jgi:hypothetical protein